MSVCVECGCRKYRESDPGHCKCGHGERAHAEGALSERDKLAASPVELEIAERAEGAVPLPSLHPSAQDDASPGASGPVKTFAVLASLASVGAGIYLLSFHSLLDSSSIGVEATSYFEIIAKGLGTFLIAVGLYVGPALWTRAEHAATTKRIEQLLIQQGTADK